MDELPKKESDMEELKKAMWEQENKKAMDAMVAAQQQRLKFMTEEEKKQWQEQKATWESLTQEQKDQVTEEYRINIQYELAKQLLAEQEEEENEKKSNEERNRALGKVERESTTSLFTLRNDSIPDCWPHHIPRFSEL